MANYKLIIEYDGARYSGWQRLGQTGTTIQGKIEEVLSRLTGEAVEVIGSGRTDAGVHALAQAANFHTDFMAKPEEIMAYLNKYLPEDIVIKAAKKVDDRFHSRFHAKSKIYLYRIWNNRVPSALLRKFSYHFPEELHLDKMREGANLLLGTHDFKAFSTGKTKKSTIRSIYKIELEKKDNLLEFVFEGDGFLYNMVRIMVGTLIEVGAGRTRPEDVVAILESQERAQAGPTVPPQGLFLVEAQY